jgi:hypothetical protein
MYGQAIDMPSSWTLRSQPPKIGIQYPNRIRRLLSRDLANPGSWVP